MQIDGDYIPSRTTFGGANYFDKETQIMHVVSVGASYYYMVSITVDS